MSESILDSVKKSLGLSEDYDVFDFEIIMHINSVFSTLNQIGVGPSEGFMIEDADPTWNAFLGRDPRLNNAKSYVYLKVKLLFDPPSPPFLLASYEKQIQEYEWRLMVQSENEESVVVVPGPTIPDDGPIEFDGGGAGAW